MRFLFMSAILMLMAASAVAAETAAVTLERAIHAEQAEGNLERAIVLYRETIAQAEAQREIAARAWLGLAEAQRKLGRTDEARESARQLIDKYPDQKQVAERAQALLTPGLEIGPAPWGEGDQMRMKLRMPGGKELGVMIYSVERFQPGWTFYTPYYEHPAEPELWRLRSWMIVPMQDYRQYTDVIAGGPRFMPRYGRTNSSMLGEFEAQYPPFRNGEPQGNIQHRVPDGDGTRVQGMKMVGARYDNEQALQLIRRLPLAEGYSATLPIFTVQGGQTVNVEIKVVGRETVTVPAGEFDCFKIDLSIPPVLQQNYWISTDSRRAFVRMAAGGMEMVLERIGPPEGETIFESDQGFRLTLPPDWHYYESSLKQGSSEYQLHLISPQTRIWAGLFAAPAAGVESAVAAADGDIVELKSFFQNYEVTERDDTLRLGGLPACRFVATYELDGKPMTEYRTYILAPGGIYWFVFRVGRDAFGEARSELDRLMASFEVTGGSVGAAQVPAGGPSAEKLAAEGWRLWRERKLPEAERAFEAAVARDGSLTMAWNGLGWARLNQGKQNDAQVAFQRVVELDPKHSAALNGLGWLAKGRGEIEPALDYWRRAVEAAPNATAAWNGLATTYLELDRRPEAIAAFEAWLQHEPASQEARQGLAKARGN